MSAPAQADRDVLVVGPAWVGDMVMAQSLTLALSQQAGIAAIDVLAPAWSLPLIRRMPEVRAAIELPVAHGELALMTRWRTGRGLRERRYALAIVLPRSFKSALVPFFAGIPARIGYRGELRSVLLTERRALNVAIKRKTAQRFVALACAPASPLPPIPQPRLAVDADNQQRLLETLSLTPMPAVVGMMPGAEYGPAKCWPLERFAELAARVTRAGRQIWIFGSAKEAASGATIAAACARGAVNLCGRTRLEDVVDLLALAPQVVTNDSGLMHVAAAVGAQVIALYGSSSPTYTPPLTARATVLYRGLACSPCFARVCPLGHFRCLLDIGVDEVEQAVMSGPA